jgi:diguanylate cyclase (GGDEF)-like protein
MRILIVEDDDFIATALTTVLAGEHYAVEVAKDGQAAWELVELFPYDLLLLDVMLPKLDGITLCRQLRSSGYKMPILLLTGLDSGHEKALGLDAGADDYLVKPFDAEELVARVRALLRRGDSFSMPILEWGNLRLDPTTHEVTYKAQPLQLTPKEYALLELLLRNTRRVFSCSVILEHIWAFEETPGEDAVRTHIKGLRQKFKAVGANPDLIETVYGIGYRLKPIEAKNTLVAAVSQPVSSETNSEYQTQSIMGVTGVWERYKQRICEQVAVLEQFLTALLQNQLEAQLRQQAEQEAHTLAGSLGTFGFAEGSSLARKIERILKSDQSLHPQEAAQLRELVLSLRQEIERTTVGIQGLAPLLAMEEERPLLLVVDSDRLLAEQLVAEAASYGLRTKIATNLSTAMDILLRDSPNIMLLDFYFSQNTAEGLSLLAEASKLKPPVSVLVFTAKDSLSDRLEVARLGGRIFLHKPVPPAQVLEAVTHVLQRVDSDVAKVMIVDDEPEILASLRSLLEPWGLIVTTLGDPRHFWETLEASSPDLLILDINMPYISGIELCQVVRNDSLWGGLPIVFLTAHTNAEIVHQVFTVGADDFVSKPIVGPELVTRIINRLERIKLLRSLAEKDPLTRVANRQKSSQDLEKFLRLSQRYQQPLCLAILDLDHFKQINDRYGHATGDLVLRQMGQLLMQSFKSEDVVARWGGEEFVIGMYGMTRSEGVQRIKKVLQALSQLKFTTPDRHKLRVTFSAGVAEYPGDGADLQSLYQSADAALYQAKLAGRNRVKSAGEPVSEINLTKP